MVNLNRPQGFKPKNIKDAESNRYLITVGQATKIGDVLRMGTAGTLRATTAGTTYPIVGVQASAIIDETDGLVNATALAGDIVSVYDDPNQVFVGQITSFTRATAYVTRTTTGCLDEAGSAGVQYIDAAATTLDTWKVLRESYEEDGQRSTTGAYANVECVFNPRKHLRGPAGATT